MAEPVKSITLHELNSMVKTGIKEAFPGTFWILAEISELNINQSGHCYLELIEKATESDQIIARAKATIWAFTFRMLKPYFESVTGQRFSVGLKIMVQVSVEFHEQYGFSLNIKDIEPSYTLGDLTLQKQEVIKRLKEEGVYHLNKELELPSLIQKIAIISSDTAAGYGDFENQLHNNPYGFAYYTKLFKAYMQGNEAEESIINALERIFQTGDFFDVVVIIRGGGAQADLHCFNSYWLSYHITQFPIPVISGIGHERDETITDLVAHTNVKTPTAAAEFILAQTGELAQYIDELQDTFVNLAQDRLNELNDELTGISNQFSSFVNLFIQREQQKITKHAAIFRQSVKNFNRIKYDQLTRLNEIAKAVSGYRINEELNKLKNQKRNMMQIYRTALMKESGRLEEHSIRVHLLDPAQILQRGYSLTYLNGMLIKSAKQLKPGDTIESKWLESSAESKVETVKISKKKQ